MGGKVSLLEVKTSWTIVQIETVFSLFDINYKELSGCPHFIRKSTKKQNFYHETISRAWKFLFSQFVPIDFYQVN